jgi:hypothetical protein
VFENKELRRMFGCERVRVEDGDNCIVVRSFIIYPIHQILLGLSDQEE